MQATGTVTPAAPTVTTAAASSLTATGATLGGSYTANNSAVTEDGIVYSTTNTTPTTADTKVTMTTGTPFSQAVTLAAGTYYIRAYAIAAAGTGYGAAITLVVYAAPTITSLSPTSVNYGSGASTLTINGTNFVSGVTTATYGGTSKTVTFVSATQITIPITATNANTVGTVAVVVTNPTPGGGSASANFTVNPVAPTTTTSAATSVSYTTATINGSTTVGSGNASVTDRGFYVSTTAGQVTSGGGTKYQPSTTTGSGSYSVALTGLTSGVTYYFAAYSTNSAGTTYGSELSFTTTTNPVPTLTSISPSSAFAGDNGFTLTATGTGFVSGATINFNGAGLTTTYVSATSLTAAVPASAITTAGSYPVTVTNPTPGGGTSGSVTFTVNPPAAPSLTTTSPATAITSSGATLNGNISSFGGPAGSTPAYGFVYSLTSDNSSPTIGGTGVNTITTGTAATTGNFSSVVSGLSSNTSYSFQAYATNSAGTTYGGVVTFTTTAPPVATTYTWTGTTSTSWSTSTNWTPTRTTPATSDILIFNGATVASPTVAVDFTTSQTIGQLRFINNVSASLTTAATRTLTIDNNLSGDDFVIGAGSSVSVALTSAAASGAGLAIKLTSTETGAISGSLTFNGYSSTVLGQQSLQGAATGAIQFLTGSIFTAGAFVDGSSTFAVLGTTTVNSVVFNNGSRYNQLGGSNPFYLSQPSSIVVLQPASYYYFNPASGGAPANVGRTYGTLELDAGVNSNLSGSNNPFTVQGDLIVTSGIVSITNTSTILKGNLTVRSTGKLQLTASGTVQLAGTTLQTISNTSSTASALTFGSGTTLQVNNAAGATLATPIAIPGVLNLTSGLVNTTATNLLSVTATGTSAVTNYSASSYVNGPLLRATATGAATTVFPIGNATLYHPLTLTATAQAATSNYTASEMDASAGGTSGVNSPLTRVSTIRYYTVTSSNTTAGNFTGTITLTYTTDDFVNTPNAATLVVAKRDGTANWNSIGQSATTGGAGNGTGGNPVAGTITSGSFSNFSDFALGDTDTNTRSNPLPVELTFFAARRSGPAVAVTWTTASEKNSQQFVVERSLNGSSFAPVAEVAAAGTSLAPRSYAVTDATAPSGTLYYRLKQVDFDGTVAYSKVAAVSGTTAELSLAPNPARESVQLFTDQGTTYTMRSLLGQVVRTGTAEAGATAISLTGLPTGVYTVELTTATGRVVRKLVKE